MATSSSTLSAALELASAVVAHPVTHTLLGVLLGWGIAYWSLNFESRQREQSLLRALHYEIASNKPRLEFLEQMLKRDIEAHKESKSITIPMPLLSDSLWGQFLLEIPEPLLEDAMRFHKVADFFESVRIINERLASREAYRTNNGAMSNYRVILTTHDEALLDVISVALKEIEPARAEIKNLVDGPLPNVRVSQ